MDVTIPRAYVHDVPVVGNLFHHIFVHPVQARQEGDFAKLRLPELQR